jgi:hypothetical protein
MKWFGESNTSGSERSLCSRLIADGGQTQMTQMPVRRMVPVSGIAGPVGPRGAIESPIFAPPFEPHRAGLSLDAGSAGDPDSIRSRFL